MKEIGYMNNQTYLKHYGILGMKWGVRRATYKLKSASELRAGKKKIQKDIYKLHKKQLKMQKKQNKYFAKGKYQKSSKYAKKAYKRGKTMLHNEKLLRLYDRRIDKLEQKTIDSGKSKANEILNNQNITVDSLKEEQ